MHNCFVFFSPPQSVNWVTSVYSQCGVRIAASITNRLWAALSREHNLITGTQIFLFTECRPALGPIQLPIRCVQEVTQLGCDTDHSHSQSVKVKNVWHYTSTPPYIFIVWYLIMFGKTLPLLHFIRNVMMLQTSAHWHIFVCLWFINFVARQILYF
jgi:hypothetical protein